MITNNLEEALLLSDRIIPMTRGPRATLGTPVAVDLRRPRTVDTLLHDEQAARARIHVVECLTDQVHASQTPRQPARSSDGDARSLNPAGAEARP